MAGIRGVAVPGGVGVMIGSNGKLGTVVSSARFKEMIEPMDKASEAILSLKPVTFQYKKEWDPEGIRQYGLVAEEVEKLAPELVARDEKGNRTASATKPSMPCCSTSFSKNIRKTKCSQRNHRRIKVDNRAPAESNRATGDANAESERAGAIEWRAGDRCKSLICCSRFAACHAVADRRRVRSARIAHRATATFSRAL